MKKSLIIFVVLAVVVVLAIMSSCSTYNGIVTKEEGVKTAWANVETQYQRRADLIPNLVSTVKGYATHEESTLNEVTEARTRATSISVSAEGMTAEQLAEYQKAQSQVGSALGRLIAVAESYPDLKANQNFLELQAQLEGTENRISVARSNFNNIVKEYNVSIRRFPANIIAKMFSFAERPYFQADDTALEVPMVKF